MTTHKVTSALFVRLTHDVLCAYCKSFTPAQWDDREKAQTTGWQFRWCVHELCWKCAAAVTEACPVCAVSGPQGIDLSTLTEQALAATVTPPHVPHEPLWPWFLIGGLLAAGLIAYGEGWLRWLGFG